MKLENPIGWTDCTTNAVTGCDKVSPGCKNCYAEAGIRARVLRAQGIETWGAKGQRVPVNFEPVFRRLNKLSVCARCATAGQFEEIGKSHSENCSDGSPVTVPASTLLMPSECGGLFRRVRLFADSNSDWLDRKWLTPGDQDTLGEFLKAVWKAPNIDTLLLTKRIENFVPRLKEVIDLYGKAPSINDDFVCWIQNWLDGDAPQHVWLGVSVEDQQRADERIPLLLQTPAAVRFLSVEPLLGNVKLPFFKDRWPTGGDNKPELHWAIAGGESGKNRRDCGVEAIESVVQQCVDAGVPVYCKQDSALLPGQRGRLSDAAWARKEFPR